MKKPKGLTRRQRVVHKTYQGPPLAGQKLAKRLGVPWLKTMRKSSARKHFE